MNKQSMKEIIKRLTEGGLGRGNSGRQEVGRRLSGGWDDGGKGSRQRGFIYLGLCDLVSDRLDNKWLAIVPAQQSKMRSKPRW